MKISPGARGLNERCPSWWLCFAFQFVAIFAFATCTGFRGHIELRQVCNSTNHVTGATFKYPFKQTLQFDVHDCASKTLVPYRQDLDYKSSMEYYVVIGVFCFLYSLGVLAYYIAIEPDQTSSTAPPGKFSPPVIVSKINV